MTIVYTQENLANVEDEAKPLLEDHWKEIALNKDKVPLKPDWTSYYNLEQLGRLKIFTCRDNSKLVGYFVVIVGTHLHYVETTFATNDIIYIKPEYRKGFTGVKLIKFAEKCLKDDGVQVLHINTKKHKDFGNLLKRLKFNEVETIYGKYLGD